MSEVAVTALEKGKVGRFFWQRFDAKYSSLVRKRVGHTSLASAISCTEEMAIQQLDSLADDLIKTGIMTNYEKVQPGVWKGDVDGSRVINRDETPQAIRYGVDGTANNFREFVTIEPFISLDGKIPLSHVIFAAAGITSAMAPEVAVEKINNLLISVIDNGYQNGASCLESCKLFEKYLTKEKVTLPIVMLSDGHSSRFDIHPLR